MVTRRVGWSAIVAILCAWSWNAPATNAELMGHWKLDEGSGDVFADSAAGNDGFLPDDSIVEWVQDGPPGIQNVSVEFTGDLGPSFIETPYEGIGGNDPRTITLWVKAEPQPTNTAMVAWGANATSLKWHFRINQGTDSLRTEFSGGQNFAETAMADGDWHFVASVFEGEVGDDIIHYLDGEEDLWAGGTSIDIDTAIDPLDDAYPVHIGYAVPHPDRYFVGQMADVRIYDEALDEAALQAIMEGEDAGGGGTRLQAGDADMDLDFDQLDLVQVQIAAKYLSGQAANWGEGDWDGAPGGEPGNPPTGNGFFDQLDIVSALGAGLYLKGPYGAIAGGGAPLDGQTSVVYNAGTGEVAVDAPAGTELTSINIDSASGIFTGDPAQNLGGSFDNDADSNIFKATFGDSFGSVSFGNVASPALDKEFVMNDLTVVGSLAGGGGLGDVDLVYVPEPTSMTLMALGLLGGMLLRRRVSR